MKLKFLLQKNAWFIEHERSWYSLNDIEAQRLAASALPLVVVDEHALIEQPHIAGEASLDMETGRGQASLFRRACESATLRVQLREPDGTPVLDDRRVIDETALASIEWMTPPFGDGWIDATSTVMLDNVASLELKAFLPAVEGSTGKTLTVHNASTAESSEIWIERDTPIDLPLMTKGQEGSVMLHLDCDPEAGAGGSDSRRLGFVLVDHTIKAA